MFPNRIHHLQRITGVAVTTRQNDEPADPVSVPPREIADLLTNVRRKHIISHSNYPYILSEFRHKFLTKSPDPLSESLCHRPAFQLSTLEIWSSLLNPATLGRTTLLNRDPCPAQGPPVP